MSAVKIAIATHERMTIALRPVRSATPPQNGEKIAASRKFADAMIPAQIETAAIGLTPS